MPDVETFIEEKIVTKTLESEERQTIVHCSTDAWAYRVWPSTFLIEDGTGRRARLITAFNISFAPEWTQNTGQGFTLVFEGLSKGCQLFDLVEFVAENGFEVKGIARNKTDVYQVQL